MKHLFLAPEQIQSIKDGYKTEHRIVVEKSNLCNTHVGYGFGDTFVRDFCDYSVGDIIVADDNLFLKVIDIDLQKLQSITEEESKAEGVITNDAVKVSSYIWWFQDAWDQYIHNTYDDDRMLTNCWKANPWVFVLKFEVYNEQAKTDIV